jgi:hypothetical protein
MSLGIAHHLLNHYEVLLPRGNEVSLKIEPPFENMPSEMVHAFDVVA